MHREGGSMRLGNPRDQARKIAVLCLTSTLWLVALFVPVGSNAAQPQLTLTWTDNSTDEQGFSIERQTGPTGTFAQAASVGPNKASYIDSGLAPLTTYCYRV